MGVGPAYGYVGAAPSCAYGYYSYYPYACAPYGYYGPQWFVGGVFIGAGPWYHGWHGPYGYYGHGPYGYGRGYYGRGYQGRGYYWPGAMHTVAELATPVVELAMRVVVSPTGR